MYIFILGFFSGSTYFLVILAEKVVTRKKFSVNASVNGDWDA